MVPNPIWARGLRSTGSESTISRGGCNCHLVERGSIYAQPMPPVQLTTFDAEQWLSSGRLGIYLNAAGNDLGRALRLYEWNAQVTAACLHDLGHLEVLIRNFYDVELSKLSPNWTSAEDQIWAHLAGIQSTKKLQTKSNAYSKQSLSKARKRLHHPTHGQIVANLTFGFWTALTQAERDATIWTPILNPIFPGSTRGTVHNRMDKLNTFRNRLAHWEPVFSKTTGLMKQLSNVDELFTSLSPAVAFWVSERSTVVSLIKTAPEPLLSQPPQTYLGIAT